MHTPLPCPPPPTQPRHQPLYSNPGNSNHDIHALGLGSIPLVAKRAVLLVIPEGTHSAVHAAATTLFPLRSRGAQMLDNGTVGDVFECGLRGFGGRVGVGG
jgi:hypothetical protein